MSQLSKAAGAVMFCLALLFSASVVMATQEQPKTDEKAQKKEKNKGGSADQQMPSKSDTVTISGKVTAVSDTALTIVDDQKAEHTVAVTSETVVVKSGKGATLTDVKANDMVVIEAKKAGDALTAVSIAIS